MADQKPLSDEELKEIRQIIEHEKRVKWLWSSMKMTAIWVVAVITGLSLTWDFFVNLIIKAGAGK